MPTECCVPECTNRSNSHRFPWADKIRVKEWAISIRRDKWAPKKYSVVCPNHFRDEDYLTRTTYGTTPLQKKLRPKAVPSLFAWTSAPSEADLRRRDRVVRREVQSLLSDLVSEVERRHDQVLCLSAGVGAEEEIVTSVEEDSQPGGVTMVTESCTQTDAPQVQDGSVQTTEGSTRAALTYTSFVNDDKGIHFYTGLETYTKFVFVFCTLGPAAFRLNYYQGITPTLPVQDQFLITLMKLRRNTTNFELSRMFCVSEACISNIFITWINFIYLEWSEQPWWPSRDLVRYFSPSDFKSKYPTTRVIVDGTECPIKKPKQPVAQQATYSSYKNRNTVKVLVGTRPGGLVSSMSTAYGGSASDRQIVERSTLPRKCDPGDSVMADKGFNVQDIFIPYDVVINIPTFFSNTNRMSCDNVLKDRQIASKRVHVERSIGLGKTYKILTSPMNNTESALATRILFVCFALTNFRKCIVPLDA